MTGLQVAALENAKDGSRMAIGPFVTAAIWGKDGRRRLKGRREKDGLTILYKAPTGSPDTHGRRGK
jgi:hypothetical protein